MTPQRDIAGVLVSLKPEFATAIAEGRKTVELRRRFPSVDPGVWLVIYVTQPVGAVVGMARIEDVRLASVNTLWRRFRGDVAISKSRFDIYFASQERGFAVLLGEYHPVVPVAASQLTTLIPNFTPPQSWRYVTAEVIDSISAV